MNWLRAFIAKHIIDTDPNPQLSRLDLLDLPAGQPSTTSTSQPYREGIAA